MRAANLETTAHIEQAATTKNGLLRPKTQQAAALPQAITPRVSESGVRSGSASTGKGNVDRFIQAEIGSRFRAAEQVALCQLEADVAA